MHKNNNQYKINLIKILKHDYALLSCTIFTVIMLGMILYALIINDQNMVVILLSLEVVFICLGLLRVRYIKSYLHHSFEIKGVITSMFWYKDRGRVTYTYELEDITYKKSLAIMKTKQTKSYDSGQEVDLLVKKTRDHKAVIKNLYI